jgi:hypothetical protein
MKTAVVHTGFAIGMLEGGATTSGFVKAKVVLE